MKENIDWNKAMWDNNALDDHIYSSWYVKTGFKYENIV